MKSRAKRLDAVQASKSCPNQTGEQLLKPHQECRDMVKESLSVSRLRSFLHLEAFRATPLHNISSIICQRVGTSSGSICTQPWETNTKQRKVPEVEVEQRPSAGELLTRPWLSRCLNSFLLASSCFQRLCRLILPGSDDTWTL